MFEVCVVDAILTWSSVFSSLERPAHVLSRDRARKFYVVLIFIPKLLFYGVPGVFYCGLVSCVGYDDRGWTVYLLVDVPKSNGLLFFRNERPTI